jgi:hypothetical protein
VSRTARRVAQDTGPTTAATATSATARFEGGRGSSGTSYLRSVLQRWASAAGRVFTDRLEYLVDVIDGMPFGREVLVGDGSRLLRDLGDLGWSSQWRSFVFESRSWCFGSPSFLFGTRSWFFESPSWLFDPRSGFIGSRW